MKLAFDKSIGRLTDGFQMQRIAGGPVPVRPLTPTADHR
jgi:hypothetical protein